MLNPKKIKEMEEEEHKRYHRRLLYIFIIIMIFLFGGSTFYNYVEGWRFLDAIYFSAYTMTTIGYGDITPKTDLGKVFTIFYMFASVSIALYGLSLMASHFVEVREEVWLERLGKMNIRHHTKTFWDKLKGLLNYKSTKLVSNYNRLQSRK